MILNQNRTGPKPYNLFILDDLKKNQLRVSIDPKSDLARDNEPKSLF